MEVVGTGEGLRLVRRRDMRRTATEVILTLAEAQQSHSRLLVWGYPLQRRRMAILKRATTNMEEAQIRMEQAQTLMVAVQTLTEAALIPMETVRIRTEAVRTLMVGVRTLMEAVRTHMEAVRMLMEAVRIPMATAIIDMEVIRRAHMDNTTQDLGVADGGTYDRHVVYR
jgi:hypothetical protein